MPRQKSKFVREGYNKIAEEYHKQRDKYKNSLLLAKFQKNLPEGSRIIDLGCGAGVPVAKFLAGKGQRVVGIDFAEGMLRLARKNVPKAKFMRMDMTRMKFKPNSFDGAVSFYAIIHVPREKHAGIYRKLHQIVKPGGIILVNAGGSDRNGWEAYKKDYMGVPMFWSYYCPEKTRRIIEKSGFEIIWGRVLELGGEKQFWVLAKNKKSTMPARSAHIQQWKKDEKATFQGWDFSYLNGRYKEETPDWNYDSLAKQKIRKSHSVLDMATGGGEVFSKILHSFRPTKAVAIEGYKPNVPVAIKNLKKFRVNVIYAHETKKLPFENEEFDLVLNRHGGLNTREIGRILAKKGVFLTQQVDGRNLKDLMRRFGAKPKWEFNTLSNVTAQLAKAGFEIKIAKEWKGNIFFYDVGALVYFLKAIPWLVDDFSVEKHLGTLEKLQKEVERKGELRFTMRRFLILAEKGA